MLLKRLTQYLKDVDTAVRKLTGVHIERYEEEVLTPARINLRIRIRFVTGNLLAISDCCYQRS